MEKNGVYYNANTILSGVGAISSVVALAAPETPVGVVAGAVGTGATVISMGFTGYQDLLNHKSKLTLIKDLSLDAAPMFGEYAGAKMGTWMGES